MPWSRLRFNEIVAAAYGRVPLYALSGKEQQINRGPSSLKQEVLPLNTWLYLLLRPQTIAINAPSRIPSDALRPFLDRTSDILCIGDETHVLPASILSAGEQSLTAYLKDHRFSAMFSQWQGGRIVVLFPVGPRLQYLLVLEVQKVSENEVELFYIDPRTEERFQIGQNTHVGLQLVAPAMTVQILSGQLDIVRQMNGPSVAEKNMLIDDKVTRVAEGPPDEGTMVIESSGEATAMTNDISSSGMGLSTQGRLAYSYGEGALVYATLVYPQMSDSQQEGRSALCRMRIILGQKHSCICVFPTSFLTIVSAILRGCRTKPERCPCVQRPKGQFPLYRSD